MQIMSKKHQSNQPNLQASPNLTKPLVIVATGASLTRVDVEYAAARAEVWCVKEAYQFAPTASLIYCADEEFWDYSPDVHQHGAEKWTANRDAATQHGLNFVRVVHDEVISLDQNVLHSGYNSGFQALNLAILRGYKHIILLGFDMCITDHNRTHFFGVHPPKVRQHSPYSDFIRAFTCSAPTIEEQGVKVVNATRITALECFEKATIEQALPNEPLQPHQDSND
jgi:hypothetical protein